MRRADGPRHRAAGPGPRRALPGLPAGGVGPLAGRARRRDRRPAPGLARPGACSQREPEAIDGRLSYFSFDAGSPIMAGTAEAVLASADVALTGADLLLGGERAAFSLCRPPGHHAALDLYGGYCFVNNAAAAAQALLDDGMERVAVVDVDYHHGNGTQDIFWYAGRRAGHQPPRRSPPGVPVLHRLRRRAGRRRRRRRQPQLPAADGHPGPGVVRRPRRRPRPRPGLRPRRRGRVPRRGHLQGRPHLLLRAGDLGLPRARGPPRRPRRPRPCSSWRAATPSRPSAPTSPVSSPASRAPDPVVGIALCRPRQRRAASSAGSEAGQRPQNAPSRPTSRK